MIVKFTKTIFLKFLKSGYPVVVSERRKVPFLKVKLAIDEFVKRLIFAFGKKYTEKP